MPRPKPKWWDFNISMYELCIRTPWFYIIYSDYNKDIIWKNIYWLGLEVGWGPNKNIKEGDLYFRNYKRFIIDKLSQYEVETTSKYPLYETTD